MIKLRKEIESQNSTDNLIMQQYKQLRFKKNDFIILKLHESLKFVRNKEV